MSTYDDSPYLQQEPTVQNPGSEPVDPNPYVFSSEEQQQQAEQQQYQQYLQQINQQYIDPSAYIMPETLEHRQKRRKILLFPVTILVAAGLIMLFVRLLNLSPESKVLPFIAILIVIMILVALVSVPFALFKGLRS